MLPWIPLATAALLALALVAWRARAAAARRARSDLPPGRDLRVPRLAPKDRHLLLLMIDGLPTTVLEEALAAGTLPNLARLFAARPTLRMTALSTFPSATAPSLPELLAGRYVALDELPAPGAVHAFDREQRRIVPASMRLLGHWNWWAPPWFERWWKRSGIGVRER